MINIQGKKRPQPSDVSVNRRPSKRHPNESPALDTPVRNAAYNALLRKNRSLRHALYQQRVFLVIQEEALVQQKLAAKRQVAPSSSPQDNTAIQPQQEIGSVEQLFMGVTLEHKRVLREYATKQIRLQLQQALAAKRQIDRYPSPQDSTTHNQQQDISPEEQFFPGVTLEQQHDFREYAAKPKLLQVQQAVHNLDQVKGSRKRVESILRQKTVPILAAIRYKYYIRARCEEHREKFTRSLQESWRMLEDLERTMEYSAAAIDLMRVGDGCADDEGGDEGVDGTDVDGPFLLEGDEIWEPNRSAA